MFDVLRMKTVCKTTGLLPFRVKIEKVEKNKKSVTAEAVGKVAGRSIAKVINLAKTCINKSAGITHSGANAMKKSFSYVVSSPVKKFWSGFKSAQM